VHAAAAGGASFRFISAARYAQIGGLISTNAAAQALRYGAMRDLVSSGCAGRWTDLERPVDPA
jgi:FAD/FMN-containing dehydrogenase